MKKNKENLTLQQEEYIKRNYHNCQTWKIAEDLNITNLKLIYRFVDKNKIKKDKDFFVIRKQNSLTLEQCNFILNNYNKMSNKEILNILKISKEQLSGFSERRKLKKDKEYNDKFIYSEKIKNDLIKLYPTNSNRKIQNLTGLTKSQILYLANELNLKKNKDFSDLHKSKLTYKQKEFIIDNYSTMTTNKICKNLNLTHNQVKSYSSNLKLKKESNSSLHDVGFWENCLKIHQGNYNVYDKLGKEKEPVIDKEKIYKSLYGKYSVNQNYFNIIDNEWKAYWLGFLYADGMNKIKRRIKSDKFDYSTSLCLAKIDKSHIEKFKNSLQSNSPIRDHISKLNGNIYNNSKILICNKQMCEDLNRLGCVPNKSLILKFPTEDQVPKKFIRDFIRGYFDGDGCIHINLIKKNIQFNLVGTLEFIEKMQEILIKELDITKTKIQKSEKSRAYSFQCGSVVSIQKIYNYLYKNCNIYLDRKLKKFNTLLWLD